ncbi:hypothetical protein SAY86_001803 [Trapa natans]|uniref:Uncharacterized protein n=1 Tax=Trapa natans TaxID=22666 RepID=A0AAN7LIS0_TRANT|nr:hypothetical protein SAY86_001803 [Trapa natans]
MKLGGMCSCFCSKSKQGQDEVGELEALSPEKKPKVAPGNADATAAGCQGAPTAPSNDGTNAALVMSVAHTYAMEGGISHGPGGDG